MTAPVTSASGITERILPLPTTVYIAKDADGAVLYVGASCDVRKRMAWHRSRSPWIGRMADLVTITYPDRLMGALAEKLAINKLRPEFNRALYDAGMTAPWVEKHVRAVAHANTAGCAGCSVAAPLAKAVPA